METKKSTIKNIAIPFGLLLGLFAILISVINYITGQYLEPNWMMSVLNLLVTIGIIIYAIKKFKTDNDGFLSLGEAIKIGLAITVISGVILAIYNYLFMTVIEPDFVTQLLDFSREKMIEQNPEMTEKQLEMALSMSEKFMNPAFMSAMAIIGSLFTGFIISLIGGLVMKQNRPEFQ